MRYLEWCCFAVIATILVPDSLAQTTLESFVISTESSTIKNKENDNSEKKVVPEAGPEIYDMNIRTNVTNRFASTSVISKVRNLADQAKETTFSVLLPEQAFITKFVMEIDGKSYEAYVKEKEEAKQIYDKAVQSGQSAAHVALSARDSNKFVVSVNVDANSKAQFTLLYEELLQRKNGKYDVVLNVNPGQIVPDLNIEILINETVPLKFVNVLPLRSGNEISKNDANLNTEATVHKIDKTSSIVKFVPNAEQQKELALALSGNNKKEGSGLSGQFVVEYDVERDQDGGEILLNDGYFVHFFAPAELKPLPKHVVFALDTSGSMSGQKIDQLKDAMKNILSDIRPEDSISVVEFASSVFVWNIQSKTIQDLHLTYNEPYGNLSSVLEDKDIPSPVTASHENVKNAQSMAKELRATSATNIIGALEVALFLVDQAQKAKDTHQPIIIFLTDGAPNVGKTSTAEITDIITKKNKESYKTPIFSLGFGYDTDKKFLRKLSLRNSGFARQIYLGGDASLQLQDFYKLVSSPALKELTFKYADKVSDVSQKHYPLYLNGAEIVVAGKYASDLSSDKPSVEALFLKEPRIFHPKITNVVSPLERLWAYLTVQQTLEKRDITKDEEEKKKLNKDALELALKYSFVTPVTSLVVVKPNDTSNVNAEEAAPPGVSGTRHYYSTPVMHLGGGPTFALSAAALPSYPRLSGSVRPYSLGDRMATHKLGLPSSAQFGAPSGGLTTEKGLYHQKNPVIVDYPVTNLRDLKWFRDILNNDDTITLDQKVFSLGLNATNITRTPCPQTPLNSEAGQCIPVLSCPEVAPHLPDLETYKKYFCPLEEKYAGVCCPQTHKKRSIVIDYPVTNLRDYKWFKEILNSDDTITLDQKVLSLGLNVTSIPRTPCPQTPFNSGAGLCTPVVSCPGVAPRLPDLETYKKYSCIVDEKYAGVCCPEYHQENPVAIDYPVTNMRDFKWFRDILNNDDTITLDQKELSLRPGVNTRPPCPQNPLNNEAGQCTPLLHCQVVASHLPNLETYKKYFCLLDEKYAGVCCPKKQQLES